MAFVCSHVVVEDSGCRLTGARSNFVVAITFPRLLGAFKPQGAFGWYAGWNIFGFCAILLFVPETKALSLEELDQGKYPPPLLRRRFIHTPFSLFGAHVHPCGVSTEGAATQHQEVHLPHAGRRYTTTLRTRRCHRGETLCTRRLRPCMRIYRRVCLNHMERLPTMYFRVLPCAYNTIP